MLICLLVFQEAEAQRKENMDEAKVGAYILPNALSGPGGKSVKNHRQWEKQQRPWILSTFATHMYGRWPDKKPTVHYEVISIDSNANTLWIKSKNYLFLIKIMCQFDHLLL